MISARPRPSAIWWFAGVAAIVTTFAAGCSADRESPESRLRAAVTATPPMRYRFREVPDAEHLVACFTSRRPLTAAVDRSEGIAALSVDDDQRPIAFVTRGRSYIRSDVLVGWSIPTPWATVHPDLSSEARLALSVSLGESIAAYVLAFDLPEDAITIAQSSLKAKQTLTSLGDDVVSGVEVVLIQVQTNVEKLPNAGNAGAQPAPILTFALDHANRIVRVAARLAATDPRAIATGYSMEYLPYASTIGLPDANDVTPISVSSIPARPAPVELECAIGPTPTRP